MGEVVKIMKFRPFKFIGKLIILIFYVLFDIQPQATKLTIILSPIELKTKKDIEFLKNKV
jgi:hypothetical protein